MSTTSKKSPTFAEWIQLRTQEMNRVQILHNEAVSAVTAAQALADRCRSNPCAYSHSERVEIARDLIECKAALDLIQADEIAWQSKQVGKSFLADNITEIVSAARTKLSELTARMTPTKEPHLAKIFEWTRQAIGMAPLDRGEILDRRDKAEALVASLEEFAEAASTKVEYLKNNPTAEALTDCIGGLSGFENALATASK